MSELEQLNTKMIQTLSFEAAQKYADFPSLTPVFWEGVRANLTHLSDIKEWWNICCGTVSTYADPTDVDFIQTAIDTLPLGPWEDNPWDKWVHTLKEKTARKGKSLFMPLRRALTGQDHGPELKTILFLMGPERAKTRMEQAIKK